MGFINSSVIRLFSEDLIGMVLMFNEDVRLSKASKGDLFLVTSIYDGGFLMDGYIIQHKTDFARFTETFTIDNIVSGEVKLSTTSVTEGAPILYTP